MASRKLRGQFKCCRQVFPKSSGATKLAKAILPNTISWCGFKTL
jgi:hypothetical protein